MKTADTPNMQASHMKRRHEQGVALIIVLAMLMLLSALLVAFMSSATTELTASQAASAGSTSRQLAESTVNLVIGQMREATTSPDESTTWSSQPGAIRTYSGRIGEKKALRSHAGANVTGYFAGNNDYVFKLYSADNLKVKSDVYNSRDLPIETGVIENWSTDKPLEYVDLNEPVVMPRFDLDPSGKTVSPSYPIIDPRAMFNRNGTAATSASNPPLVEGFDAKLSYDSDRILADGGKEKVPYLPMPVKWLYVLKDGTVGAPDLATKENPIVGRTAFWVDDESTKLNINTSAEGTYWDTPSVSTDQETGDVVTGSGVLVRPSTNPYTLSLASASPANGEYQRYGGHPYTTCLSPVLGGLWNLSPSMSLYPMVGAATNPYRDFKEAIYKITPFTPNGPKTTIGATRNADPDMPVDGSRPKQTVATKHIYASVDELMFKSQRNTGGTNPRSELNDFSTYFTPEALEKTRFFLTANSRAPELNLFGRPRVTLWPVNSNFRNRTTFDDLFAFSSTIAKTANETQDVKYYLARHNARDDKEDYDSQNKDMYEYLQFLTEQPTPGYGDSIASRYPKGETRNQILTEIFDYVRSINLVDTGEASRIGNEFIPYTPRFYPEGVNNTYSRTSRSIDWSGQVTPLKIGNTMGMGRFVVISEAALIFHKTAGGATPEIQATLALEMATTMPGFPAIRDTYWTKIVSDPVKPLKIQLKTGATYSEFMDVQFCTYSGGTININNVAAHDVTQGRGFMPVLGFTSAMHYYAPHRGPTNPDYVFNGKAAPERDPNFVQTGSANPLVKTFIWNNPPNLGPGAFNQATTVRNYPYVSKPLAMPAGTTHFKFQGPLLKVEIWSGQGPNDSRSKLVQTVNLDFKDVTNVDLAVPTTGPMATRFDGTLEGKSNPIATGDVVRGIEFTGPPGLPVQQRGDLRIAAVLQNIPPTYYLPRDAATTANSGPYFTATPLVHGLTRSHGDPEAGHTGGGKLVAGGNNRSSKPPILPAIINGVQRSDTAPGDWDRGISKHMDGAFGNKVDEGNLKFDYAASGSSRLPYFRGRGIEETGQSFFTPNRQLPSAVMLGSLPSGIDPSNPDQSKPWQTLLFRPDRDSRPHPGSGGNGKVPEHVWLDLFHVPVVEPYAISEPFSTAGKVNMNYVIAPFGYAKGESGNNPSTSSPRSYLRRDSALRGVLRSVWMLLVPSTEAEMGHQEAAATARNLRWPIDLDKTIDEMEIQLNDQSQGVGSRSTNLFRSASQICDIDLYPKITPGVTGSPAPTVSNWTTFWNTFGGTGDNQRERPYAFIYPRLTTKSNVYTIHMRCQVIRKAPSSAPNEFDPVRDQVVSEYRGSSMIERFIDPNDENLLKYNHKTEKVDPYYRFRVVGTKQFVAN